jgi:adenylosuccinate lyase
MCNASDPVPSRALHPVGAVAPSRIEGVIGRYSRPAMAGVWSEAAQLERWLEVELAALAGWEEVGVIPAETVRAIRAAARPPSPERVAEIERRTNHDLAAFVDAVAETLGEEGRWFHYGLTSSDVIDTALALAIQEAGSLVLAGLDRAFSVVVRRADEHRETLMAGRTHGVHAEPTTFGLKLAGWAFALDRDRRRIIAAVEGMRVGKLSGAVGTYAAIDPVVEKVACDRLGLEPAPVSTQILQRDRHAEVLAALALLASSLDRFATEVRHLARTEVAEVEEPFAPGQKGSSAMPHKRNPITAERISGLARVVRANSLVGLENVALWHERDISHSSAERVVLPDSFLAVDYMLDRFAWLLDGLVVRPQRMRENLERSRGLHASQRLLLALVRSGLGRDDAYRAVQRHAMRAWDEGVDFASLVRADREIADRVSLDDVFDLGAYTRHVDVVFERLHALAGTRAEPTRA